jgi:hypothetical protein
MKKFKSRDDQHVSFEHEYFGNKIAKHYPQTFESWKTIAHMEFELILGHQEFIKLCKISQPKESGSSSHFPSHNRKRERTDNTQNSSEKKFKPDSQGIYPCQGVDTDSVSITETSTQRMKVSTGHCRTSKHCFEILGIKSLLHSEIWILPQGTINSR